MEIISVTPSDKVPIGTKVTLKATTNVADANWSWTRACNGANPWLKFFEEPRETYQLQDCVGASGKQLYRVSVAPNITDDQEVEFFPPDNVMLKMGRSGRYEGNTTLIKHDYKFHWGTKALGPCAQVCVQESLTWKQSEASKNKIGTLANLKDVPEWWPTCPFSESGVAGNPDLPNLISWKWDSPDLVDWHGLEITPQQLQKCDEKFVIVEVTQVVRASGTRCKNGNWEFKEKFVFEWFVYSNGGNPPTKKIGQRIKK